MKTTNKHLDQTMYKFFINQKLTKMILDDYQYANIMFAKKKKL